MSIVLRRVVLAVIGAVLVSVVLAIALSWAPGQPVEELAERWCQSPSEFASVEGMQVHLRDEGPRDDPRPLVLLHGTSSSLHTWQGWSEALRDERRVVRFDLPGFGLTGPAPDGDYRIERYAEFVLEMLDELDIERAVLGGNSLGGQIAWETGLLAPDRIDALVLVNAAGYPFEPESMPLGFRLAQIPGMAPFMNKLLPRAMIESSLRNVYGDPQGVDEELVDLYYDMAVREGNRQALIERFRQTSMSENASSRIQGLTQPALIIWGDRDRLIPPALAERFHADIANSELAMLGGLGHVPHEEAPEVTAQVLGGFLSGMAGRMPAGEDPDPSDADDEQGHGP